MAEFCGACAPKYGMLNDFVGECCKGQMVKVLCEGCGWVLVDHTGKPVGEKREQTHNDGSD